MIVDAAVLEHDTVAIGGGGFGINVHLAPATLVDHLDATIADVSDPEPAA